MASEGYPDHMLCTIFPRTKMRLLSLLFPGSSCCPFLKICLSPIVSCPSNIHNLSKMSEKDLVKDIHWPSFSESAMEVSHGLKSLQQCLIQVSSTAGHSPPWILPLTTDSCQILPAKAQARKSLSTSALSVPTATKSLSSLSKGPQFFLLRLLN